MQTSIIAIVARIEQSGPKSPSQAKDFLDVASRTMIDVTLASLAQSGKIAAGSAGRSMTCQDQSGARGGIEART